ncbi:hypothetical protein QC7_2131 [Clostridioides difficile CD38]|nr:hypothetical protein QC7_2131 [Clostridioides difficile CD38]EQF99055.1 hypothetical protein QGY_2042 [Clostridioides difficile 840]EQK18912.1 hypothetical protein QUW_1997 [Clostridioides difficile P72]
MKNLIPHESKYKITSTVIHKINIRRIRAKEQTIRPLK